MESFSLALETAFDHTAVAFLIDGDVVFADSDLETRRHVESLFVMIDRGLKSCGLSLTNLANIYIDAGPGHYTGLRVGAVSAKTLAFLSGANLYTFCSLDLAALMASDQDVPKVVTFDAKRNEVYVALYDETAKRIEGPQVKGKDDLEDYLRSKQNLLNIKGENILFIGDSLAQKCAQITNSKCLFIDFPDPKSWGSCVASSKYLLEQNVANLEFEPIYLREPDSTINWNSAAIKQT